MHVGDGRVVVLREEIRALLELGVVLVLVWYG